MACHAHNEFVMPPVLIHLIGISGTAVLAGHNSRRAQERYAKGVVVGFIRAILAVGEDGRAEAAALVGEIDPTMRGDFKLARLLVRALDSANVPAIGCVFVRRGEWEGLLQICAKSLPIDGVGELHAIARVTSGETNGPRKF